MKFEVIFGRRYQRGTYLYMKREITANTLLGNQAAIMGGSDPASANVRVMVKNKMKINDSVNPSAI